MTRRVSSSSAEEVARHWNVRDAAAHLTRRSAMRAVLYEAFRQLPEVVTVDDPACPETGVVIEVAATGLCRSDWHGWMGHDPDIRLPHVPGHEFAGVIAEVGSRVPGWPLGDRVTAPFVCACGQCETCRRGEHQVQPRDGSPRLPDNAGRDHGGHAQPATSRPTPNRSLRGTRETRRSRSTARQRHHHHQPNATGTMNLTARPLAFSYVRTRGPRGITIRTGRESPAQDSPAGSHPPQAKPNVRIMPRWVRVRVRVRMAERHSGDLSVGVQPEAFRRVS